MTFKEAFKEVDTVLWWCEQEKFEEYDETTAEAWEMLKRIFPVSPDFVENGQFFEPVCPSCSEPVEHPESTCHKCGQCLDWSEYEFCMNHCNE